MCAVLILVGVGLEIAPSPGECPSCLGPQQTCQLLAQISHLPGKREAFPGSLHPQGPLPLSCQFLSTVGVSSAIFFVPGILLLVPGVYHVIFIYCAVKGRRGFQFFYLPYFEK